MEESGKEALLEEILHLLAYGDRAPEIDPALLAYLDISTLQSTLEKLKEKTAGLKEEDRQWLQQFRKEEE
jgi:hypothetical protein